MAKIIEFNVIEIEGEIVKTSNKKHLLIYEKETGKYHKKQSELYYLAYPKKKKTNKSDWQIDFINNINKKPKFDIDKKMKALGYHLIIDYKKPAYFTIITPFAKIEKYLLKQRINFITSDGECIANMKIKITLK
jgi:hypothetical protein